MSETPLWPVVDADELLIGVVHLFARRPDLPQKILNALASDKIASKRLPLFNLLFLPATEADGAKHYFAGYRVQRPKEIDLALGAANAGEMIEGNHDASMRKDDG